MAVRYVADGMNAIVPIDFDGRTAPAAKVSLRKVVAKHKLGHVMDAKQEFSLLIVELAQSRQKAVFAAIFRHFAPRIKGFLMRSGVSADKAEELAQESLLNVWRKAALYDPQKASASTWVYAIARNVWIDALRREKYPDFDMLYAGEEENDVPASDGLIKAQDEEQVRSALGGLPQNQRTVILMHYFEDKPHSDIARELNLPLGTVKSRLRLAVQKLRSLMDGGIQ